MEAILETIATNIAITLVMLNALILGEAMPIVLPRVSRHFSRKPFNCRPCATFHLIWMGMATLGLVMQSWETTVSGLITALVAFFIIRHIENKKITK